MTNANRKGTTPILVVVTSFCIGVGSGCTDGSIGKGNAPGGPPETTSICCGSGAPAAGYILVDSSHSTTTCGGGESTDPGNINVCKYQRYDNKSQGTTMKVCSSEPTPLGWADVSSESDPTRCGWSSATPPNTQNVKTIRKQ